MWIELKAIEESKVKLVFLMLIGVEMGFYKHI
jgi:hypothetical protein